MIRSNSLEQLRLYLEKDVLPHVSKWDQEGIFPKQVFEELHTSGITTGAIPKKYGGPELSTETLVPIYSLIAEYSPGIVSSLLGNLAAQTAIARFGSPSLCSIIFESQIKTRELMSFCATEKGSGTDIRRIRTTAVSTDRGYVLNGYKSFITNANYAAHLVVLAQTEDQDGSLKLSAFYVPAQSPGIKPEAPLRKLGQNESNTAHITFKNVRIPHIYLLGEVGQGLDILESCVSRTKALIAGAAIGICISAHSVAMDYLRNTLRYNRPLIELSSIRNQLAQLHVQVQAARELAYLAARTWDACGKANSQSSAAKYYGAHTAMKFVEAALELCGASGYLAENRLGKLFRDAKLLQIYEGASLVQLAIIGKDLFDTATSQQSNASELFGSKFKKAS